MTITDGTYILDLRSVRAGMTDLVGGKAVGLGEAREAGLAVPEGFCLTTAAYRETVDISDVLRDLPQAADAAQLTAVAERARQAVLATPVPERLSAEIIDAYRRLGDGVAVAVRSSATAEDLPHASFAGQQDTYLTITGAGAVVEAVRRCWASLWSERAVAYRAAGGIDQDAVAMAVVVQVMVDAQVAGVLFTANPVTGTRTEMVVDAAPGLGEAVVSGTVNPDHYVLGDPAERGCLSPAQQERLLAAGRRLQEHFGTPQDAEWAFDTDGELWLLQSRPITTLFPIPHTDRPGTRVYLSVSHAQGVLRPLTPMGMSVMRMSAAAMLPGVDPLDGPAGFVEAGGRMYADLTAMVRNKRMRENLPETMRVSEPRAAEAVRRLLGDPRFAPQPGLPFRARSVLRSMGQYAPALVGIPRTLLRPDTAPARAARLARELERLTTAPAAMTTEQRLAFVEEVPRRIMGGQMMGIVWILMAGMGAAAAAPGILGKHAKPGEVDMVLRGMPHNVTTEMDLALWHLAMELSAQRETLLGTPPAELADRFRQGTLPVAVATGLSGFLALYGRRAVAEIDVGVPRWSADPTQVFLMLANYLRLTDPDQAPDRRFARAAAEAEAKLAELAGRLGPVRGRLARLVLRRARATSGIRELPKFAALHGYGQMREQLLLIGADLAGRGLLERADDVMFLNVRQVRSAVQEGCDLRNVVAERRDTYEREMRRRHVPAVLLSDGTDAEALAPAVPPADGVLVGMPAAPGTVTGVARVISDPAQAHLEPGEILVAPSTDPGWTPLFLTAGGLVTETGGAAGHGPTVAREYGIPAVVGVRSATEAIQTGQRITLDGAAGTITFVP